MRNLIHLYVILISLFCFNCCNNSNRNNKNNESINKIIYSSDSVHILTLKDSCIILKEQSQINDNLFDIKNIDTTIAVLNQFLDSYTNNEYLYNKCINTIIDGWYEEDKRFDFTRRVEEVNNLTKKFNGIEYLYRFKKVSYDVELTESILHSIYVLTLKTPDKFLNFYDSLKSKSERFSVLSGILLSEKHEYNIKMILKKSKYSQDLKEFNELNY